jgi:hypothetical protein
MNILNELLILSETKEKNLIGLTIDGKKITEKTPSEHWAGHFYCYNNKLTSLVGSPASISGDFDCSHNQPTSLKGIEKILKKMNGTFYAYNNNPLKSHVIGLLLVPGCKKVRLDNDQVQEILNRHLKSPFGNKRVIECQSELLDAGLDEWAKL